MEKTNNERKINDERNDSRKKIYIKCKLKCEIIKSRFEGNKNNFQL